MANASNKSQGYCVGHISSYNAGELQAREQQHESRHTYGASAYRCQCDQAANHGSKCYG